MFHVSQKLDALHIDVNGKLMTNYSSVQLVYIYSIHYISYKFNITSTINVGSKLRGGGGGGGGIF